MSSASTERLKARRASDDKICEAQAGSSAALAGRHTKTRSRVGVSLTPVTLYGPSTTPSSRRGMPDGLCASSEARSPGSQAFCSLGLRSRHVNATSCGPAVIGIGGDFMAAVTDSCAMLMPSATLSSERGAADLGREHGVAVDDNQELVRTIVPFYAEQAFLDAANEPAREHVLTVGRERVRGARAAASAERHAVQMLVLRQLERDTVLGGRQGSLGIADGHVRDAQRHREIALEQQRRRRQNLGDVVEAEVAAVARQ